MDKATLIKNLASIVRQIDELWVPTYELTKDDPYPDEVSPHYRLTQAHKRLMEAINKLEEKT